MRQSLFIAFLLMALAGVTYGQVKGITGRVTSSETGEPVGGVSVLIKGSSKGASTDKDGFFRITAQSTDILVFSSISYTIREVKIDGRSTVNVSLSPKQGQLNEVVVTALGLTREKKSVGYAIQEVKGSDLTRTNETNVLSSLSGKVAGMQVTTASGAVGAGTRVVLRGNNSFGENQPLFVVDGVPVSNSYSNMAQYGSVDYGTAMGEVDPNNIASVTVLKGSNAAALYGSRGGNGVVLITTKNGKNNNRGIGVSYTGGFSFEKVYILPHLQFQYGQGEYGDEYFYNQYQAGNLSLSDIGVNPATVINNYQDWASKVAFSYADGKGGGINDGYDESWGPRLNIGLLIPQYNSPLDANGNRTATPWVSHGNQLKEFFQTGNTIENNIALSSNSDKGSTRFAIGQQKQIGTVPNTDQKRYTLQLNTQQNLTDRFKVGVQLNYVRLENSNIIGQGYNIYNPMQQLTNWMGRQVDVRDLKANYMKDFPDGFPYNWNNNYHDNPYFIVNYNTHSRTKDRLYGNFNASYKFGNWLNALVRVGDDVSNENRMEVTRNGSNGTVTNLSAGAWGGGIFRHYNYYLNELNTDFILTGGGKVIKDISVNYTAGANYRDYSTSSTTLGADKLTVPNLFTIANAQGNPVTGMSSTHLRSNSVYGQASIGYKDWLYLDATGRNDWSSTLPSTSWSYFYPSVSLSWIFSNALHINSSVFDMGKIRGSWAKVGNATDPYQLAATYGSSSSSFNGTTLYSLASTIPPQDLKPESSKSEEVGLDLSFFKKRITLDATYYNKVTTNQILSVNISTATGFNALKLNAGDIRNHGIELQLGADILRAENPRGLNWNIMFNWAQNRNKVNKLYEDPTTHQTLQSYNLGSTFVSVNAIPGHAYGVIQGTAFTRDAKGHIVVNSNGMPIATNASTIGNITPDWTGGVTNSFYLGPFSLSFLIDMSMGGDLYSQTMNGGEYAGALAITAANNVRETGVVAGKEVLHGTVVKQDGSINDIRVAARDFFYSLSSVQESDIIKATYIKLREIAFNYAFPAGKFKKLDFLKGASVSLFAHNVALLYKDKSNFAGIDPETSAGVGNNGLGVETQQIPSSRSIGLKLNFNF